MVVLAAITAAENLLPNGDFEQADPDDARRPAHWDLPDGLGVQWLARADGAGTCIVIDTRVSERAMVERWKSMGITQWDIPEPKGNAVADTYGLSFYSAPIPIVEEQAYRLRYHFRGPSGGKVWVRAYAEIKGRERRLYEAVSNVEPSPEAWREITHVFHPTRAGRPEGSSPRPVTSMRVMLYAFHPPGLYRFDDVAIEAIKAETYAAERSTLKR